MAVVLGAKAAVPAEAAVLVAAPVAEAKAPAAVDAAPAATLAAAVLVVARQEAAAAVAAALAALRVLAAVVAAALALAVVAVAAGAGAEDAAAGGMGCGASSMAACLWSGALSPFIVGLVILQCKPPSRHADCNVVRGSLGAADCHLCYVVVVVQYACKPLSRLCSHARKPLSRHAQVSVDWHGSRFDASA